MSTNEDEGLQGSEYLNERLRQLEDEVKRLRDERKPFARFLPPEVRTHLRAAQRERLLAVRALVDVALKHTEEQPQSPRPRRSESLHID